MPRTYGAGASCEHLLLFSMWHVRKPDAARDICLACAAPLQRLHQQDVIGLLNLRSSERLAFRQDPSRLDACSKGRAVRRRKAVSHWASIRASIMAIVKGMVRSLSARGHKQTARGARQRQVTLLGIRWSGCETRHRQQKALSRMLRLHRAVTHCPRPGLPTAFCLPACPRPQPNPEARP